MADNRMEAGWAVWFTGLPGSGKSAAATGVARSLEEAGLDISILRMDERRKAYFPTPEYSAEERRKAYAMFVDEAVELVGQGRGVVMDGSAHLLAMRAPARERIARFAEVHVRCDLEEAMRREERRPQGLVMAGMYRKALERKRSGADFPGLGEVIGVDIPFEEDPRAECRVDNTSISKAETLSLIMDCLTPILGRWGAL